MRAAPSLIACIYDLQNPQSFDRIDQIGAIIKKFKKFAAYDPSMND